MSIYNMCLCNQRVRANVWSRHMKSCSSPRKDFIINILDLKKKYRYAWRVDTLSRHENWYVSVIHNDTTLSDWLFETPRLVGCTTTKSRTASSYRMKQFNKSKSCHLHYNLDEIRSVAKSNLDSISSIKALDKLLESRFPKYKLWMSAHGYLSPRIEERGGHRTNLKLAFLLEMSTQQLIKLATKKRGVFISQGLRASEVHRQKASINALRRVKNRITKKQTLLYKMIVLYDPNAILEYEIVWQSKYRSYDIFIPSLSLLCEMHGRFWHDLSSFSNKEKYHFTFSKIQKNIENDAFKEKLAKELGFGLAIFWDDEWQDWNNSLNMLFKQDRIIDVKQIANQIGLKLR